MRYLLLFIPFLISTTANAQLSSPVAFDSLQSVYDQKEYEKAVDLNENHQLLNRFSKDSLAWVQLRITRSYLNMGYYVKAVEIIEPAISASDNFPQENLGIRMELLYALALKKKDDLLKAVDVFESSLSKISPDNYTERVTGTINYANTHWELGNYKRYADLTSRALGMAKEQNDARRHILTRQNLIEYYQKITGEWGMVVAHLDTLSNLVAEQGDQRNHAWHRLRQGVYYRDKLENYPKAVQSLQEAGQLARSEKRFQIWEQSSYELLNTYFVAGRIDEAGQLILQMKQDDRLQNIPAARYKLLSRQAQYHMLREETDKARPLIRQLQDQQSTIKDVDALALGYHAEIMYYIRSQNISAAKEKIINQLELVLDHKENISEGEGMAGNILYLYSKAKYSGEGTTLPQIKQRLIDQYMQQKVKDWVFEKSGTTPLGWLFMGIVLLTGAAYGIRKIWSRSPSRSFKPLHSLAVTGWRDPSAIDQDSSQGNDYARIRESIESR